MPGPQVISWLDELRHRRALIVRELVEVDRAIVVAEKASDAEREAVR